MKILIFETMNKLDKQFEQIMKGAKIDSPSENFGIKVMSRILAEAAVTRRTLLQDYQPVISKRAWIILIGAFVLLMAYIIIEGIESGPSSVDYGVFSTMADSVSKMNSSVMKKGFGLFSSIPTVAYLIVLASLSLWTIDSFLSKLRHNSEK